MWGLYQGIAVRRPRGVPYTMVLVGFRCEIRGTGHFITMDFMVGSN